MANFLKWYKKNMKAIEYNNFNISIKTSCDFFMVRYPSKDYSPKISECTSGNWSELVNVIKNNILYVEVFVNNQKRIFDSFCEIKIEELNSIQEVINISYFRFKIEIEIENFKWNRFEVKSILD